MTKLQKSLIKEIPCAKCGKPQLLNIPFRIGKYVGVEAAIHECGEKYRSYSYTSTDPKEREEWLTIFNTLQKILP